MNSMDTETETGAYSGDGEDNFSDVVLLVENERFNICKCLLCYASPVFRSMFTLDFREKEAREIHLPGKSADDIRELLNFLNPGMDDNLVNGSESALRLLPLAEEYQIQRLRDKCSQTLLQELMSDKPMDFVLKCLKMSQQYPLNDILEYCIEKCSLSKSLWRLVHDDKDIPMDLKAAVYEKRLYILEKEREELMSVKQGMMGIKHRLKEIISSHDHHCRCRTELKLRSPMQRTCSFCARVWCSDNVGSESYRSSYWFLCNHRIGYTVANDAVLRNFIESKD